MRIIKKIIRDIWGFSRSISEKHVPAYAAQAAYFIILSFIPFILLLMTSIRYTQLNREEVVGAIMQVIPDNLHEFIQGIVDEVYNKSVSIVPVSAVMAIWSSGKGVQALTNGFNCIYSVYETRNYILTRIRSAAYTLLFVIGIILTLTLQVFGNTLQRELRRHFPFLNKLVSMIISQGKDYVDGIRLVQEKIKGSCSMLLLTEQGIIAARDKYGRSPILVGRGDNGYAVSSETSSFPTLGYEL